MRLGKCKHIPQVYWTRWATLPGCWQHMWHLSFAESPGQSHCCRLCFKHTDSAQICRHPRLFTCESDRKRKRKVWKMKENTYQGKKKTQRKPKTENIVAWDQMTLLALEFKTLQEPVFFSLFCCLLILLQWCIWLKGPLIKGDKHNTNGKTTPNPSSSVFCAAEIENLDCIRLRCIRGIIFFCFRWMECVYD